MWIAQKDRTRECVNNKLILKKKWKKKTSTFSKKTVTRKHFLYLNRYCLKFFFHIFYSTYMKSDSKCRCTSRQVHLFRNKNAVVSQPLVELFTFHFVFLCKNDCLGFNLDALFFFSFVSSVWFDLYQIFLILF